MTHRTLRLLLVALTVVGAATALVAPAALRAQTPDPMFQGFAPIGDFALVIDGETVKNPEIYQSDRARAILVMSPQLDQPVLFNLRSRQVQQVGLMSLAKRADGTIDVLAQADVRPIGSFSAGQDGATATIGGKTVSLTQRESLTGPQGPDDLISYDPSYGRLADQYTPNDMLLDSLRKADEPVRVQVFFNSKCGVCKQMVPRIIKVDRVLSDDHVTFQYYGLPDAFEGDPIIEEKDVHGVPTGIVYRDGEEVGRIVGNEWKMPELAIKNTLTGRS